MECALQIKVVFCECLSLVSVCVKAEFIGVYIFLAVVMVFAFCVC